MGSLIEISDGFDGPHNSVTDPETGYRTYTWEMQDVPSVTTIKSMAGMSYPIHRFALNNVVARAVDQVSTLNRLLAATDEASIKAAKDWLLAAATEERDRAADLGTRIHDAAARMTPLDRVPPDVHPQLKQFYGWIEQEQPTILHRERQVWNLTLGYAGTFDLMAKMPDGGTYIIDIKTGKSTFPEHALQLLAYSMGEFIGNDDLIDSIATDDLVSCNGIAILHLQKTQWKWLEIDITPEMYAAFNGLLTYGTWSHAHRPMKSVVLSEKKGSA